MTNPDPSKAKRRLFEPPLAILMALATLSTAWCFVSILDVEPAQSGGFAAEAGRLVQKAALLHLDGNQVWALMDAMSIHRERIFAWESRVPDLVVWLLLFGAVTAVLVARLVSLYSVPNPPLNQQE